MMLQNPGKLIVFEGIDGTGKSTQLALLAAYLHHSSYPVVVTKEPTEGGYGKQIRQLYTHRELYSRDEELALFVADRREHVQQVLLPALQQGKIILCDRYYLSTAAYQGAKGFDPLRILEQNRFAPEPDIALLFKAPLAVGLDRITAGRGDQLNDFERDETLARVAAIFDSLTLTYIHPIDANGTIASIQAEVRKAIMPLLADFEQRLER